MKLYVFERIMQRFDMIDQILKCLEGKLRVITHQQEKMMSDLSEIQAEVTRNTEVDQSAITLLNGLAAQIEQIKTDPAAIQALANELRASSDDLAAAVVANTPAQA